MTSFRFRIPRIPRATAIRSLVVGLGICIVGACLFVFLLYRSLPSVEEIGARRVDQSTKFYDREGKVVLYQTGGAKKRTVAAFADIPASLKQATVAIEDEGFYTNSGISVKGILRAFVKNITNVSIAQGGSTITQQLARNAFLTLEQTPTRKIKELMLALKLNRLYSKDEILGLYLNEIPYGPTIYGAAGASEAYFGKPIQQLTLAESALLASIPKAPSYYSPFGSHVDALLARQKVVLQKMKELGVITDADYATAINETVHFVPQRDQSILAPHFVFAVQDYLVEHYGEDAVQRGGLRVITTLDARLQSVAERVVKEGAERNEKLYGGTNAALYAEDPKTGQVLALVGSRDYFDRDHEGNFNVALQGLRQPGSSLKPFVYLTAFMKGYTPDTMLFDVPTEFAANRPDCPAAPDFESDTSSCFHPENFDHVFRGPVSLRTALAQSINVPAVKTLYLAGMPAVLETLSSLGVTTLTDPSRFGLSLVLGGGEVHLNELVGAYSALAADGIKRPEQMLLEVRDADNTILESYEEKGDQVIDPYYARLVNTVLSDIDARSGLFSGSLSLTTFPGRDIALKTGTTNNYRDAWTVGYTPSLVAGVWAGNNDNTPMKRQGSSILAALPIWNAFMKEALSSYPEESFLKPEVRPAAKPILGGSYSPDGEIHTILQYIDRTDPLGPPPANPSDDPQYLNWEFGVRAWALEHGFHASSSLATPPSGAAPLVSFSNPPPGSFISSGPFGISGTILSGDSLTNISIRLNGSVLGSFSGPFAAPYSFVYSVTPNSLQLQNTLSVEALSSRGVLGSSSLILYTH